MSISIILSSHIGGIKEQVAGTEVMFFSDVRALNKHGSVKAFARFAYDEPPVERVFYPLFLLRFVKRINTHFMKLRVVDDACRFVAGLIYAYSSYLRSTGSDLYLGYSCPQVALLPVKRKIILLQSHEPLFFSRLFGVFYRQATYIFCSNYLMQTYHKRYPFLSRANSVVLHNAVDTKVFSSDQSKQKKRRVYRCLYVSAWVPEKGLDYVLKAYEMLSKRIKSRLALTIASNQNLWYQESFDRDAGYIRRVQRTLDRHKDIRVLGGIAHEAMHALYRKYDYLLFPSIWGEPCSVSLIESLFSGLPVVAFNVGGNAEIVSERNSVLLPTVSVTAMSKALGDITTGKYLFQRPLTERKNYYMSLTHRTERLWKIINAS